MEGCGVDVWAGVLNEDVIGGTTDDEYDDDDDDDDDDVEEEEACAEIALGIGCPLNGENLISTNTFPKEPLPSASFSSNQRSVLTCGCKNKGFILMVQWATSLSNTLIILFQIRSVR